MAAPAGGDKKNIVKMAYIYFQEGKWDKAIEEYKKLLALDPEDMHTHNMLGDVYVKKGAAREAYDEYSKVAADMVAKGQHDKAAVINKKIASLESTTLPPDARSKQNLIKQTMKAETAMEQGDTQGAIDAFSEVLKLDPENIPAYAKLAELLVANGKVAEAVQQYAVMGAAFMKNRLYKKAQEIFQKIVELDPAQVEARVNLAQIYIKQGSESDAKKEYLTIAEIYYQQGDMEKAQQNAAKAIEFKSIEAHFIMGMIYFRKKQYAESKLEYENLLRFKVNHVGALTHLGLVYLELSQFDKASEQLTKALKVEKDNPKTLEAMAELNMKKGAKGDAAANLISAVDWYIGKKDFKNAIEVAKKAVSVDPALPKPHQKLGDALKGDGQKSEAAQNYMKAAELFDKAGKKGEGDAARRMAGEEDPSVKPAAGGKVEEAAPQAAKPMTGAVMDLEDEALEDSSPAKGAQAPAPMPAAAQAKSVPMEADPQVELKSQLEIAANYIRQELVEEAIEIYQQLIEAHPDNAEIRAKLNQAYTLYVRSGDDVIGAIEAEKKAKEEEERKLRDEIEKRAKEDTEKKFREETERKLRDEMEKKAREEAVLRSKEDSEKRIREEIEKKLRDEMALKSKDETERKMREEMEKKIRAELEHKSREAAESKLGEEMQKRAREEADRKMRDEVVRRMGVSTPSPSPSPAKTEAPAEDNKDDFMTIAVADIYTRQGLYEGAHKIYKRIVEMEPDNFEAKKKLADLETLMKSKGLKTPPPDAPPAKGEEKKPVVPPSASPSQDKDSVAKKKPGKVGYV